MDRISQNSHDFAYRRRLRRKAPDPKRLDILKASIKTVSKEYCEESSICGLKHLVDDNTPFIERIIWIVTLVVGLICSVSLVWMTFDKYYSAPLVTTQLPEGIPVNKIIFPAVGICTNNRISKRAATELAKKLLKAERNQNYTEEEMMSLLFGLGQLYGLSAVNFNNVSPIELHNALGEYDVHELMQSDCNNYRGINLMSHTMKVWEKVIEKRQREESEIIQNQFGFMQGRGTMDAIFELHQLCERYRRAHKNLHKVFIHPEKVYDMLTPRCEDLLVRCVWNSEPRNCLDLFDFRLTMNGYCCTFNYLRPHDTIFQNVTNTSRNIDMYRYGNKSYFDYDQGLKVLLRLNESDDFFYNIPLQGAQLQFSDAYDFPDSPSGSFAMQIISPSVQMSVMVTASFTEASRDIQHVPIKLRKCRFYDESSYLPFYTYSDCMLKCRMHFLLDNCNCTPFNMLKMINARTCNMKDVPCLRTYYSQSISVRPIVDHVPAELELDAVNGGIDCPMCNPTCSKTAYSYDFNNVVLYPEYLNTVPDSERDEWQQGVNFTGISFVHVKYARDVADCYGQNVIMKWFDLISNIGSTCGFITGFSFVSVLEFIYFFTVKLVRELFRAYHTYHKFDMTAKESWRRYLEIWWNGIKSLPQTTSIHGFRFIADTQRHWLERIFWLIVVALSWYGSSLLIAAQYDAFQNNPISFVVETTYKDWNTEFPAVVVCENDNSNRVEAISDGLWGVDHDFNMEEVLKELAFFKGITYYTSEFCNLDDPLPDCMQTNLTYYANLVRSTCQETLANCSWNGIPFECCKYFRPMDTELGTCFAINTLQGREKNAPRLDMVSNSTTGPGAIKFDVMVTANIYILNEEEVPTLTTIGSDVLTVGPEIFHKRYITIRNIENDAGARLISPEKRKCRYTDENFLQVYHHYSYTACTVQCRKDAQLELCNCTNYFMPNVPEHLRCNVSGIICLNSHVHELSVLKASWSSRAGLACNCLPSCTEAEITITKDFKLITSDSYASVQIELAVLPSERYRRNVVRGVLDLVVSTGGTGGLFLGASILSFVELFYILLIRPFCDIYSQRDDDPWHRRFGLRRLQDNNFIPNWGWTYERKVDDKDNAKIEYRNQR